MKGIASLALAAAALLSACSTAPVNVDNAKAVIVQNETTKKHIQTFTDTNKKTRVHVQKVQEQSKKIQEQAVKESDAMDQVIKDARTLLGTKP
jgi:starvation-inducible outer membrane lipoprotein